MEKPVVANIPKTKAHFATMGHKINTEKLREMLREKCRIRVKESRHNKFDGSRQFLENEKQWLTGILQSEFNEFEMDLLLEDIILKELIEEQYQWMIEQYELSNDVDLSGDPKSLLVLCPICQVSEVKCVNNLLHCGCGFQLAYNGSLDGFWKKMQKCISEHEEKCVSKLSFFMDTHESALNVTCDNCDFLALVG